MDLIDAVREILREPFVVDTDAGIVLREDKQPRFKPVTLLAGKESRHLVLRFEVGERPSCGQKDCGLRSSQDAYLFPLIQDRLGGVKKLCDYVVLYRHRDKGPLRVLLCECKAGGSAGATRQLQNSRAMVQWILELARLQAGLEEEAVEYKGILWAGPSSSPSRPRGGYQREGNLMVTRRPAGVTQNLCDL